MAEKCPACGCPGAMIRQKAGIGGPPTTTPATTPANTSGQAVTFDSLKASLVLISVGKGGGSGFVVEMGGKKYLVTNQHVFGAGTNAVVKTIDGRPLNTGAVEIADKQDLVRVVVDDSIIPALSVANGDVTINDPVAVCGNSQGSETLTWLQGHVVSVGPEKIEVNAPFVRGNSGSPIVGREGKVLGVATLVTFTPEQADWTVRNTQFAQVRRFGIRLDSQIKWVPVNKNAFLQQMAALRDIGQLMEDLTLVVVYFLPSYNRELAYAIAQRRPALIGMSRQMVENFNMAEAKEQYGEISWPRLIEEFSAAQVKFVEYSFWMEQAGGNATLPSGHAEAYRKKYGQTFNVTFFKKRYIDQQAARDKAFAALTQVPKARLKNTQWMTTAMKETADALSKSVDAMDAEFGRVKTCQKFLNGK